jgi:hypothetical protein
MSCSLSAVVALVFAGSNHQWWSHKVSCCIKEQCFLIRFAELNTRLQHSLSRESTNACALHTLFTTTALKEGLPYNLEWNLCLFYSFKGLNIRRGSDFQSRAGFLKDDRGAMCAVRTVQTNSVALSPQANYTNWATATCRRNLVPTFVDRGVSCGQRGGSPTVVILSFLDRSCYFSFK